MGRPPDYFHRNTIRLFNYDYARDGAYFVTICTHRKQNFLGDIRDGILIPDEIGRIVEFCWKELPKRFPSVSLDTFILMPNHAHGILWIQNDVGAQFIAPNRSIATDRENTDDSFHASGVTNHAPTPLGAIIRAFKAVSTHMIHKQGHSFFGWQRNCHERIIRDGIEMEFIRRYIRDNPKKWECDEENPRHARSPSSP